MGYDKEKAQEMAMALLWLHAFEEHGVTKAWKGIAWEITDALFERGWIVDPKGRAKSVVFTEEGEAKARELFAKHLGQTGDGEGG